MLKQILKKVAGLKFLIISGLCLSLLGCATIFEPFKVLLGTSTREVEAARKNAISQEFNIAYETAFKKSQEILKQNSCKIFYQNKVKGMIIAMNFTGFINTSEAGIFFTQIEPNKTKLEVASQSQEVAKSASKILFAELEKLKP